MTRINFEVDHTRHTWAHFVAELLILSLEKLTSCLSTCLQVSSSHIFGDVLLQSPSIVDSDQRDMFCFYLFPGNQQSQKVCMVTMSVFFNFCLLSSFLLFCPFYSFPPFVSV